jgi:hypothetical protein
MSLDLWFREDVARVLWSAHEAMSASFQAAAPSRPGGANAYRQGFEDALQAAGVAFGVALPRVEHSHPFASEEPLYQAREGREQGGRFSLLQTAKQRVNPKREERW